ncbi:MAG: hypothetical protein ABL999_20800 [Pyrinomonadaceae bacterium]
MMISPVSQAPIKNRIFYTFRKAPRVADIITPAPQAKDHKYFTLTH